MTRGTYGDTSFFIRIVSNCQDRVSDPDPAFFLVADPGLVNLIVTFLWNFLSFKVIFFSLTLIPVILRTS